MPRKPAGARKGNAVLAEFTLFVILVVFWVISLPFVIVLALVRGVTLWLSLMPNAKIIADAKAKAAALR